MAFLNPEVTVAAAVALPAGELPLEPLF